MTREAFIRKWLANKDFQYCEDGRAQMREDLDKVIYHAHQKLNIASVMQAEGSDVSEWADVGQRSVDKTVSAVCAKCGGTGILKGGPTDSRKDEPCPCVTPAGRF